MVEIDGANPDLERLMAEAAEQLGEQPIGAGIERLEMRDGMVTVELDPAVFEGDPNDLLEWMIQYIKARDVAFDSIRILGAGETLATKKL